MEKNGDGLEALPIASALESQEKLLSTSFYDVLLASICEGRNLKNTIGLISFWGGGVPHSVLHITSAIPTARFFERRLPHNFNSLI